MSKINFAEKAKQLLHSKNSSISIVAASAIAASASTGAHAGVQISDLILEESYVGYWNASGFFTEIGYTDDQFNFVSAGTVPDGATISDDVIGNGVKLYGSASMADNELGNIDATDPWANSGNEAYGVAFIWRGSFANELIEGDFLSLDYEFDIGFTDNQNTGSGSVYWELYAGIYDDCCGGDPLGPFSSPQTGYIDSGDIYTPGTESFSDSADGYEIYPYGGENFRWEVMLAVYWDDEDAYNVGINSGDTLTVTIPSNSIDAFYQSPNAVPLPGAAWLFLSAVGGLIAAKRKSQN